MPLPSLSDTRIPAEILKRARQGLAKLEGHDTPTPRIRETSTPAARMGSSRPQPQASLPLRSASGRPAGKLKGQGGSMRDAKLGEPESATARAVWATARPG
ncbi:hypothetical protein BRADI_1g65905v3 [Brachypodium distachyon]|uniref:Uncharacterized protein n=1 Tax=Brachypodium distachyon TaxID=15368 RepID=A0A2K2DTK6_BRADI|nr:hypothetical protein BRADI_1g65905v3 [Brachypodium distachyon]